MAKKNELKKEIGEFSLLGIVKVNDYTFDINKKSKSSEWVGNKAKLYIDCGDNGDIYCETQNSGYFPSNNEENPEKGSKTLVYAHGQKVSDRDSSKMTDDYKNRIEFPWEDRFDSEILETLGGNCFYKSGLEVDVNGKNVIEKFITPYDFTKHLKENLVDGMVVKVSGKLVYSVYNDESQIKKEIDYIGLTKVKPEERDKFYANFSQTIYATKESLGTYDKEKQSFPISAYVVDYVGKVTQDNETKKIGKNACFKVNYQLPLLDREPATLAKLANLMFGVKKATELYQLTVDGEIRKSGGADTSMSEDDLPDDIKELIDMGAYTLEDALEKVVGKKSYAKEEFLILKPQIKLVGEEDDKKPVIQIVKSKFIKDDLIAYQQLINEAFGEEEDYEEIGNDNEDEEVDEETAKLLKEMGM